MFEVCILLAGSMIGMGFRWGVIPLSGANIGFIVGMLSFQGGLCF